MSSTMVMTMTTHTTTLRSDSSAPSCPSCGYDLPPLDKTQAELVQSQLRIAELEAQVRQLNEKATAAVNRWTSYEAELTKLRSEQEGLPVAQPESPPPTTPTSLLQSGTSRISSLLYSRKNSQTLRPDGRPTPLRSATLPAQTGNSSPTGSTAEDLLEALNREQSLRKEAEGRLSATSKEVEELSVSLFEQANEMVADERRAKAKLEERVSELEKRDVDKKRRLDRLEVALERIERAKKLIAEQ